MSKEEEKKLFVADGRNRHGENSRKKAKSVIMDELMLYVGCKSGECVIRIRNHHC